jgi:hypothetical protein
MMSGAKKHQRPNPTMEELAEYLDRIPRYLGVWRAGQHGLYHLLRLASMSRILDFANATQAPGDMTDVEAGESWRHTTSTLIEWHSRWAKPAYSEPQHQDVVAAVRRARDWRALETVAIGLRSGDMHIAEANDWAIRIGNSRDHAVEVLDIMLEQFSVPTENTLVVPSLAPVHDWFADHEGHPRAAHTLPKWVMAVMYRWALGHLISRGLTMPEETNLGGLTLAEARACYAFLIAKTELAYLCTTVLRNKDAIIWYSELDHLRESLAAHVSQESADAFIHLCRYGPGRNPASAPLIPDGQHIAIPNALVSPVGFERALLRAASADPARGGPLGNALGRRAGRWADCLRTIPGALVAECLAVRSSSGQKIGDLDVIAFDPGNNLIFVVETKWPIDAHTLRESLKIDYTTKSGHQQLSRIKAALSDGATIRWPTGWRIDSSTRFYWWVGTAQQLASRPALETREIRATSLRLVEHILPARSVADLQQRLAHFPLPRLGIEYELIDQTLRVDRYCITLPAIAIHSPRPIAPEGHRTNKGWI